MWTDREEGEPKFKALPFQANAKCLQKGPDLSAGCLGSWTQKQSCFLASWEPELWVQIPVLSLNPRQTTGLTGWDSWLPHLDNGEVLQAPTSQAC